MIVKTDAFRGVTKAGWAGIRQEMTFSCLIFNCRYAFFTGSLFFLVVIRIAKGIHDAMFPVVFKLLPVSRLPAKAL